MPFARVNGTNLHVHAKGRGVPIVFIHPPLLTKAIFNYQTAELSGMFRTVVFDIRGHGISAPSEQPLTYPLIAEDTVRLMDHLDIEKAFICGYSTGGSVALEAMLSYPGRFYGGIVLSGMPEAGDPILRARIGIAAAMCRMNAGRLLALAICFGNADSGTTFANLHREAARGNSVNWEQYYRCSLEYNCTARLKQLRLPVLLVFGEKDRGFHRYAGILKRELPDCRLVIVPGAHHQLPTKAGAAVSEAIRAFVLERQAGADAAAGEREKSSRERNGKAGPKAMSNRSLHCSASRTKKALPERKRSADASAPFPPSMVWEAARFCVKITARRETRG